MAGISVTLDGDNIQLAFQKGDQATAVVMDPQAARSLVKAVGQLLAAIGEEDQEAEATRTSWRRWSTSPPPPSISAWTRTGLAVLSPAGRQLPPFMLRLKDDEARHIANSLMEILNSPRDVRLSLGGH